MLTRLRSHLPIIVTALVVGTLTAGGPAAAQAAFDALNAHKVDGKHAVSATASVANRAGKLVATNGGGRLPNNIITKAPDSAKLNGLPASGYSTRRLPLVSKGAVESPRTQPLPTTQTPQSFAETSLTTPDQCGGGLTRHTYLMQATGWAGEPSGGVMTLVRTSLTVDATTIAFEPGFGISKVAKDGSSFAYATLANTRRVELAPGAHTFRLVADAGFGDATSVTVGDATLNVADLGYRCVASARVARPQQRQALGSSPSGR